MVNTVWQIDPDTKDLAFDDAGILKVLQEEDAATQCVELTLKAWKGDFELLPSHGTEYEQILGLPVDEETIDEVIREAVFQEERVASVESLVVEQNDDRSFVVSFSGKLSNGESISMEVNVGE